jgi:hypothetical protein
MDNSPDGMVLFTLRSRVSTDAVLDHDHGDHAANTGGGGVKPVL